MFFAEDVILLGESVEKISIVLEALTKAVEEKGLRVNSKKTDHDLQFQRKNLAISSALCEKRMPIKLRKFCMKVVRPVMFNGSKCWGMCRALVEEDSGHGDEYAMNVSKVVQGQLQCINYKKRLTRSDKAVEFRRKGKGRQIEGEDLVRDQMEWRLRTSRPDPAGSGTRD